MRLISRRMLLAAGGTLASAPFARKPMAAEPTLPQAELKILDPPEPAPAIVFLREDGTEHSLKEFRGWGMVLNFWATWCAPCIAEMPALAALSSNLAPDDIAVMPLSSDRGGAAAVRRFYAAQKITFLPVLLDPHGAAARLFGVDGIPATVIVDKQGRIRARLEGAADWSQPATATLIRRLVG